MMRHKATHIGHRLGVLLVLVVASPSWATMVTRMGLDQVTRTAARIVHGTVTEVHSGRDASGLPATWTTLAVMRTLKGGRTSQVTIKEYGTATALADGTVTHVAGLPQYAVGDEVVLFLRGDSRLGFTSPVGFGQGSYRVKQKGRTRRVRRDAPTEPAQDLDAFLADVERMTGGTP